jgi:hypothetical protein
VGTQEGATAASVQQIVAVTQTFSTLYCYTPGPVQTNGALDATCQFVVDATPSTGTCHIAVGGNTCSVALTAGASVTAGSSKVSVLVTNNNPNSGGTSLTFNAAVK